MWDRWSVGPLECGTFGLLDPWIIGPWALELFGTWTFGLLDFWGGPSDSGALGVDPAQLLTGGH